MLTLTEYILYYTRLNVKTFPVFSQIINFKATSVAIKEVGCGWSDWQRCDILITFNTHTLDWRHGHCGMVLDAKRGIMLEHMSVGNPSCLTYVDRWKMFPSFVVLRYPDEKAAQKACDYAVDHLVGIDYNILAGVIKKDKSDEEIPESSHCSHIIWQAYMTAGVDIDATGGIFVTPQNLAMSDKLEVLQIYGLNPDNYKGRLSK